MQKLQEIWDLILGSGRSPGEGKDNSVQYSCLGNPMDRGAWRATVHGVTKSQTQLNNSISLKFKLVCHCEDQQLKLKVLMIHGVSIGLQVMRTLP